MLEYDNLSQKQKDFFDKSIWNGVGSRDFFINPHDLIFKEASKYHDFAYWRGGPEELRIKADKDFFHRAHSAVRKQSLLKRPFYYATSYVYFYFLKIGGKRAFEYYERPADTWEELLARVNFYFDENPKKEGRPPKYK